MKRRERLQMGGTDTVRFSPRPSTARYWERIVPEKVWTWAKRAPLSLRFRPRRAATTACSAWSS